MRTRLAIVTAAALLLCNAVAHAERLTDRQLMQLVENIDKGFDRWKDDLERRNLDEAIIKSAAGTVDVEKFLDAMEDDIDAVEDRLKPDYSAAPEVTALLRRASDVERHAVGGTASQPWKTLSAYFRTLAYAYGLSWPVEGSDTALRKTDRELAADAKQLADSVDRLRDGALKAASDADRPKPERARAEQQMKELKKSADQLGANLEKHRASEGEATRVLELSRQTLAFAEGAGPLKPEAAAALDRVRNASKAIAIAYGR